MSVRLFGILEWQKLQSYETFEIFFDSMLASYYWEIRGGLRNNDFMIEVWIPVLYNSKNDVT